MCLCEDKIIFGKARDIYNYSYQARLHLANALTISRYSQLKNHLLSYEGVSVSKSWGYERFMYRGKSLLKIRANKKSLNVFFNLNSDDYQGTKYKLQNVSNTKIHESTPSKYMIDGPRKLIYATELVDQYMQQNEGIINENYIKKQYEVITHTIEELIKMELIKVDTINKTYEEIIYPE